MVLLEYEDKDNKIVSTEDGFIHIAKDVRVPNLTHKAYFNNSEKFNNKEKWNLIKFTEFLFSTLNGEIEPYKIKTEITVEKEKQTNE